jgi:hypothetical protein
VVLGVKPDTEVDMPADVSAVHGIVPVCLKRML